MGAARMVVDGRLDFSRIGRGGYESSWRSLVTDRDNHVKGIGPKVADCVLLFSLDKPEAFPIDRWITRGILKHYRRFIPDEFEPSLSEGRTALTLRQYEEISKRARGYFGTAGGLVQECLFLYMRTGAKQPSALPVRVASRSQRVTSVS